jgi:2-polyprenyl-3-methyl-5-hydroxy-6-metoxy-1,4-benzoquinol methylase
MRSDMFSPTLSGRRHALLLPWADADLAQTLTQAIGLKNRRLRDTTGTRCTGVAMFRNDPDRDWERFGAEDPYYSVINTDRYRSKQLDEQLVLEVLQTGESTAGTFLDFAEQRFGPSPRGRALEFGCGVGRLLLPLAREFDHVTGVDISPSMLAEAARNSARAGLQNIELVQSDDELSEVEGAFDFVLSYLVFQHIPVTRGEAIIARLFNLVKPGGVAAIHFTTNRTGTPLRQFAHVLRRNFIPLHYLSNLAAGLRWNEPMMQANFYHGDRLSDSGAEAGLGEFVEMPVQFADHVGHVLFARRPAEPTSTAGGAAL